MKNLISILIVTLALTSTLFALDSPQACAARGGDWHKWAAKCSVPKPKGEEGTPDHIAEYKVGSLQSTESVNTGTFTSCDHGCMSQSTGHNVHYIVGDEGAYLISAPTSLGLSMLQGAFVSPNLPDVHIQWFLDDMHAGDKVLFAAECDKHNNCRFWLPKPDQQGKEYHTTGWFRPRVAKTNTNQLCGTGKLTAAVEAQVCVQTPTAAPVVAPTPETAPVAAPVPSAVPTPAQPLTSQEND